MSDLIKQSTLIDAIMEYSNSQQAEVAFHLEEQKSVLSADNFFTDNDPEGLISKEEFKTYLSSLNRTEVLALGQFFEDIRGNTKLDIPMFTKTDKNGSSYYWVKQGGRAISRGYKLVSFDGLDRLIASYQFSIFKFELTLESLFEEMKKS